MSESTATDKAVDYVMVDGLPLPSRSTRRGIVIFTLLFCSAIILLIVLKGTPGNSLHDSALSWAFATYTATVFAYVFGAVLDTFNVLKANKSR